MPKSSIKCSQRVLKKHWRDIRFVLEGGAPLDYQRDNDLKTKGWAVRFNPGDPLGPQQLGLFD